MYNPIKQREMKWKLYNKKTGEVFVGSDKDIIEMYSEKTGLELGELDEWTAQEIAEELFGRHAAVEKLVD